MTTTDDLVTSAVKLWAGAVDAWLGAARGVTIQIAEHLNPDDVVHAYNCARVGVDAPQGGPLCVGWLSTDKASATGPLTQAAPPGVASVVDPALLSVSPAAATSGVQNVTVWIHDPAALPPEVDDGAHLGSVYLAHDLVQPVATFKIQVRKLDPPHGGHDRPYA